MTRLDLGEWVDPAAGTVTFEEWADAWLAGLAGLKPKTLASCESLLRSWVLPTFGRYQLRQITPLLVREWIAQMMQSGRSAATARQARQVLHAILEQAVVDRTGYCIFWASDSSRRLAGFCLYSAPNSDQPAARS